MSADHEESVEYLKERLQELLDQADRLDLPVVAAWLARALDEIPEAR